MSNNNSNTNSNSDEETNETPAHFINFRNKRRRSDDIIQEFSEFKKEIKNMISTFMSSNEAERSRLQKDVADIKTNIKEISTTNSEIEKSIDFISNRFDDIARKVETLEQASTINRQQIQVLEDKLENLQRNSSKATVEIRNVPAKDKETNDDLIPIIIKTGKALQMDIQPSEIRDAFRIPGKSDSNKTIIAEFSTVPRKIKFLQAARDFNGKRTKDEKLNSGHLGLEGKKSPIFISEHLTSLSKKLFYLAREFSKINDYKYCWTSNGRVFIRKEDKSKQIIIKSEKCLLDLKKAI